MHFLKSLSKYFCLLFFKKYLLNVLFILKLKKPPPNVHRPLPKQIYLNYLRNLQ